MNKKIIYVEFIVGVVVIGIGLLLYVTYDDTSIGTFLLKTGLIFELIVAIRFLIVKKKRC